MSRPHDHGSTPSRPCTARVSSCTLQQYKIAYRRVALNSIHGVLDDGGSKMFSRSCHDALGLCHGFVGNCHSLGQRILL